MSPALHSTTEREMTLGVVQKEIHQGLSQADVAAEPPNRADPMM